MTIDLRYNPCKIKNGNHPLCTSIKRMNVKIINQDNLQTLKELKDKGIKFDLVELDGPYMAGLEGWDILTEAEYIQHYTARLTLIRDLLQPWGVVFVFGYPEGCAEIKSWAHQMEILYLRRWLTWYKQVTSHKGRKVENVLLFVLWDDDLLTEFKAELKKARQEMGLTISGAMALTKCRGHLAGKGGGMVWFEAESAPQPGRQEYFELKQIFGLPDRFDGLLATTPYEGLTDIDYISKTYPEETKELNGSRLRSKPVGLYLDLFKPIVTPTDSRKALILYGGSGNAGIAAAALGYDVVICETDENRCKTITSRFDSEVDKWRNKMSQKFLPLQVNQMSLVGVA